MIVSELKKFQNLFKVYLSYSGPNYKYRFGDLSNTFYDVCNKQTVFFSWQSQIGKTKLLTRMSCKQSSPFDYKILQHMEGV